MNINKDGILSPDDISSIKSNNPSYFYFTPYADECIASMDQLLQAGFDKPIITNTSWTTADIDFLRRIVAKHKAPIYSFAIWIKGTKTSLNFEKHVKTVYGREASGEFAYGYDLGMIAATVLNRVPGEYTRESVLKAFHQDQCFNSVSQAKMCFRAGGRHSDKIPVPVEISIRRIRPLKDK